MKKFIFAILASLTGYTAHAMSPLFYETRALRNARMAEISLINQRQEEIISSYRALLKQPIHASTLQRWHALATRARALFDSPEMRGMATDGTLEAIVRIAESIIAGSQGTPSQNLPPKIRKILQQDRTALQRYYDAYFYHQRAQSNA